MSGHIEAKAAYCKQPWKLLRPTGYLWQCSCGKVYRLSEVSTMIQHGREWREVYDTNFRQALFVNPNFERVT